MSSDEQLANASLAPGPAESPGSAADAAPGPEIEPGQASGAASAPSSAPEEASEPSPAPGSSPDAALAPEPEAELGQSPERAPASALAPNPSKYAKRLEKRRAARARALSVTKSLHLSGASDEVVIRFDHVTKTYELYKNDWARFLGLLKIKKKSAGYIGSVNANDDLSFEIHKGEAVAFLGLNGAGKSTALKMITGVTHPTSGAVEVHGRVSALLELTAGFDKRLTGRENIRLRGQIMGLGEEELEAVVPRAVEFANLGMYMDQPMRSYSSGMRARLGFALAVSTHPEILIVDEALSVGDRRFRKKCIRRIREIMMDENVTVLFVTHSISTAKEFCNRGIVLDKGQKLFDGSMDDAVAFYEGHF